MGDFIKDLYEKFLLRDLLSFITHGAIVVLSVLLLWENQIDVRFLLNGIHWILYIPIFGFLYMVGYAVQCLGTIVTPWLIRRAPFLQHRTLRNRSIWRLRDLQRTYRIEFAFQRLITQERDKRLRDNLNRRYERIIVHQQMAANGALATLIAGIILAFVWIMNYFSCDSSFWPHVITGVLIIVLFISLFCDHRQTVLLAEKAWEREARRSIRLHRFWT